MTLRRIVWLALVVVACNAWAATEERPGWLGLGFTCESDGTKHWLQVRIILTGGPSDKAGLAVQDVITAIDGKELDFKDDLDFLELLGKIRPNHKVCFDILRGQEHKAICVTPSEMTPDQYDRWKLNLEIAARKRKEGVNSK
jgi:S1-C subfamily serine protease